MTVSDTNTDEGREIELSDEIQAIDAAAETPAAEEPVVEEPAEEGEPPVEDADVPEKYRGKSPAELARIAEDLARSNFQLMEERAQWRKQPEEPVQPEQPAAPRTGEEYLAALYADEEIRAEALTQFGLKYRKDMARERREWERAGLEGDDLEEKLAQTEGAIRWEAWADTLPVAEAKIGVRRERERAEMPAKVRTHAERIAGQFGGRVTAEEVEQAISLAGADSYLGTPEERRGISDRGLVAFIVGMRALNEGEADAREQETPKTRATQALSTTTTAPAPGGPRVSQADLNLAKELMPELQNEDGSWDDEALREIALSHKQTTKGR